MEGFGRLCQVCSRRLIWRLLLRGFGHIGVGVRGVNSGHCQLSFLMGRELFGSYPNGSPATLQKSRPHDCCLSLWGSEFYDTSLEEIYLRYRDLFLIERC